MEVTALSSEFADFCRNRPVAVLWTSPGPRQPRKA